MLERAKKFGTVQNADVVVKGLDTALPDKKERPKRGREGADGGDRGGKRPREGGAGKSAGGNDTRERRRGRRGQGGNNNDRRGNSNGVLAVRGGGPGTKKSVLDDPTERAKAEARAKKFGAKN